MSDKNIAIWGAGKIGRGFIGDLFFQAGYQLTFIDADIELAEKLNKQGSYTVYKLKSETDQSKNIIDQFSIIHLNENLKVQDALMETTILAIAVFPGAFEDTAQKIAEHIEIRRQSQESSPLDIILCANIHHPGPLFRNMIESFLSDGGKDYLKDNVGIVESLIIRMAVEPTEKMKKEDPLVIMTNGYELLTIDQTALKNDAPDVEGLRLTDRIEPEEIRKMYTYNMIHAVYAYLGKLNSFTTVIESINDEIIQSIALGTLEEISRALQKEFNFTEGEMKEWNLEVLNNMANPILKDSINRVGGDPKRKLQNNDRLIGPALLCRKNGIMPYYLTIAIAGGYMFSNPEDASSLEIQDFINAYGIRKAVGRYSEIRFEVDLIQQIAEKFSKLKSSGLNWIKKEIPMINAVKEAYERGFNNELKIRGCAQCAIRALGETTGKVEKELFQAASGLSGGIAIVGDGSCGGYTGGVLYMGTYAGRRLDHLEDGDKIAQYKSYEMSQKLHDRFIETYGSVTCAEIHKQIFGKDYSLRTKAIRNDFEEAGGHLDKCTTVIAMASSWVMELLIDEGFEKI